MSRTLCVLFSLALLAGCQKAAPTEVAAQPPQGLHKITVAYTNQPQTTLVHVAVANHYFAEEGLAVESLMHTYGKAALQAVLDHKADFATVAETPFMFNVLKGEKIAIIGNVEASGRNNAVVGRRDAGIARPDDLKGKRIGFTPGTTSDFFLDSLLTANSLTRSAITPVALKPEEMLDAVMAGKVDAVCTWNYPLTQIRHQLGANGIAFYDRDIYTETFNIAVQQEFVRQNPDTVKRFLRALIKAEDFVAAYPEQAQAIMVDATRTDPALVREVWNDFGYRVVLDQRLLITLEDETRWAMKNRISDQAAMPDYRLYLHADSLRAVKPDAVKVSW